MYAVVNQELTINTIKAIADTRKFLQKLEDVSENVINGWKTSFVSSAASNLPNSNYQKDAANDVELCVIS